MEKLTTRPYDRSQALPRLSWKVVAEPPPSGRTSWVGFSQTHQSSPSSMTIDPEWLWPNSYPMLQPPLKAAARVRLISTHSPCSVSASLIGCNRMSTLVAYAGISTQEPSQLPDSSCK